MTNTALTNIPCDECGKRIVPGHDSSLWINRAEAFRVGERRAEWKAEHEPAGEKFHIMTGDVFLTYPQPARWRITHVSCYPQDAQDVYDLDWPSTYPEFIHHVAHVMGKTWCRHTDLQQLLEECAEQRGRFEPLKPGGRRA